MFQVINFKFPLQSNPKQYIIQYEELGFSYLTQMIKLPILPILSTSPIHFPSGRLGERFLFILGVKGLTLSLLRVINSKFALQPHLKYYITQYEEHGFSSLTQMKDDYTTNCHFQLYISPLSGSERVKADPQNWKAHLTKR